MFSKHTGLGRFVRRHSQLLTYVGALIVFTTFVIKEGLGDSWRHISESIERATYFYSLSKDIGSVEDNVVAAVNDRKTPTGAGADFEKRRSNNIVTLSLLATSYREATSISLLLEQLSQSQEYSEKLRNIVKEITALEQEINEMNWKDSGDLSRADHGALLQRQKDHYEKATILGRTTSDIVTKITNMASERRRLNTRRSKYAWWISSSLYALGWFLGLLGKVYGVAGTARSE